jgi:uncharacterized protein (DUF952 family)
MVFKILRASEWADFQAGRLRVAADEADGFTHLSSAAQVDETARLHFAGEEGLVLLALDEARLGGDLRWEASRRGALFPHLHRSIAPGDVAWSAPLAEGRHRP